MSGDAAETRPMDRTLACGCRFLRGSVFFCDAHHEGNLIRALLDEIERLRNERERGTRHARKDVRRKAIRPGARRAANPPGDR